MRILIMGTPTTSGNRGVLALASSLLGLCWQNLDCNEIGLLLVTASDREVRFRMGGEWRKVRVVNSRMSPRQPGRHLLTILALSCVYGAVRVSSVRAVLRRVSPWIDAVATADLVGDIRGGDSFSDIYGMRRFLIGFITSATVLLVRGSIVHFPQTYGPFRNPLARRLAAFLLRRSSVVVARDRASQNVAQGLVGPAQEVMLCPDVAFALEARVPEVIETEPSLTIPPSEKPIGLNVNGLMYNGGYTRSNMFDLRLDYQAFLPALIEKLLQSSSSEVWLIPHTFAPKGNVENDLEACSKVRDSLPPESRTRVRIVTREYDQYEIKGVIGKCGFFIGSRMHACIAALSQGVPCVGVAYSMKFAGVFESVGMGNCVIDGRTTDVSKAVEETLDIYNLREQIREVLEGEAEKARFELRSAFAQILQSHTHHRTGSAIDRKSAND